MKIKLLLDEDMHFALENALTRQGYDAVHVQSILRKGLSDAEQLIYAVKQGRFLVSFIL